MVQIALITDANPIKAEVNANKKLEELQREGNHIGDIKHSSSTTETIDEVGSKKSFIVHSITITYFPPEDGVTESNIDSTHG